MAETKDTEREAQSMDKKEFLDPATTTVVASVGWFTFKAVAQAILGWIGINYYQKFRRWLSKKWKKRKGEDSDDSDQGNIKSVSAKRSAAAS